jgi:hypothetical protein
LVRWLKPTVIKNSYKIQQINNLSQFGKAPINQLRINQDYQDVKELKCIKLKIKLLPLRLRVAATAKQGWGWGK